MGRILTPTIYEILPKNIGIILIVKTFTQSSSGVNMLDYSKPKFCEDNCIVRLTESYSHSFVPWDPILQIRSSPIGWTSYKVNSEPV